MAKKAKKNVSGNGSGALTISGQELRHVSQEGVEMRMPLANALKYAGCYGMSTGGLVLPDGVRTVDARGKVTILVHEIPPTVFEFKWIAEDSGSNCGGGTKYRQARIALPYIVVMARFDNGRLSHKNECFFRNDPLRSQDNELLYPALLNCSKFGGGQASGSPLSWICTQHITPPGSSTGDPMSSYRNGLRVLLHCLLETGFNRSSELNEGASWYGETMERNVDERIASMDRWVKESKKDPLFVLNVNWIPTGKTVRDVIDRMFRLADVHQGDVDFAKIVSNYGTKG